jgi:hypothetical protein
MELFRMQADLNIIHIPTKVRVAALLDSSAPHRMRYFHRAVGAPGRSRRQGPPDRRYLDAA